MPRVSNGSINRWHIRLSADLGKISKRLRPGTAHQRRTKRTLADETCYLHLRLTAQDPMSHRIIEKRRRDRMNNCLADLSRLIPAEYLKKGRGRIEKTEIIEMAIKHMKYLQQEQVDQTEVFRSGYQECMSEAVKFMTEIEGNFPRDAMCIRLLNHLQKHCEQISKSQPIHHSPLISEKLLNLNSTAHHQTFIKAIGNDVFHQCNMSKMDSENSSDAPSTEFVTRTMQTVYEKPADSNGVSYKYKTDIKLRFNQETVVDERRDSVNSLEESPCQNSSGSSECCTRVSDCEAANHRVPSDTTSNGSDHCIATVKRKMEDDNFHVPIFALHSKGAYYVPASIDYRTLSPYLNNFSILDAPSSMKNLILHPVTINVNYFPSYSEQQNGAGKKCKWTENGA